jgi:ATP-dependent Lon protease
MQESAQAAFSFVRGKIYELDIARDLHRNSDIHIHVPEGSTPKEGPSAGITIATAIISLLTDIPVSKKVAMTGEITLKGKVLPVGGIKEKLLAAYREGIREAILPIDNRPDLKDLPKVIKTGMTIHLVETMDDVLKVALTRELPKKPAESRDKKAAEAERPAARPAEDEAAKEPPLTN